MSLETDIYDRLVAQCGDAVAEVFDTNKPEGYQTGPKPVIAFKRVASVPHIKTITGVIARRETLMQVSVFAKPGYLTEARAVRELVIDALHNYKTDTIAAAWLEHDQEIEPSFNEPDYQIPIDFTFLT